MKTFWFQIFVIVFFLFGTIVVTYLPDKGLALFAGGSLGFCALLGWILTFKNKAVKFRNGFLWTLLGNLQPKGREGCQTYTFDKTALRCNDMGSHVSFYCWSLTTYD
jgi:hypothetical protein